MILTFEIELYLLTISVRAWDGRYQGGGQGDDHGGEKGGREAKVTILNYANNNEKFY